MKSIELCSDYTPEGENKIIITVIEGEFLSIESVITNSNDRNVHLAKSGTRLHPEIKNTVLTYFANMINILLPEQKTDQVILFSDMTNNGLKITHQFDGDILLTPYLRDKQDALIYFSIYSPKYETEVNRKIIKIFSKLIDLLSFNQEKDNVKTLK